jgi:uncharacterized protein
VPAEPHLDGEERALFARGVEQFNAGLYFECHDTLEEMWTGVRGPGRDFFQGLIQVSVAFYHLEGGNAPGALSMLARALARFAPYPGLYFGFDLAAHRAELAGWRERIEAGTAGPPFPRWEFAQPPAVAG